MMGVSTFHHSHQWTLQSDHQPHPPMNGHRRMGRPKMFKGQSVVFSLRISETDYNSLIRISKEQKMSLAEVGRRACSEYIRLHQPNYIHLT